MTFNVDQLRRDIEALIREHDLADDEQLRADVLEGATDINEALTALVSDVKLNEKMLPAIVELRKELGERRARLERRAMRFRELILKVLQSANLRKVQLPIATLVQVAGQPRIVGEPDADLLPDEFVRIKREPNLTAIRQALLDHREVPGLVLSNAPPTLAVKVR